MTITSARSPCTVASALRPRTHTTISAGRGNADDTHRARRELQMPKTVIATSKTPATRAVIEALAAQLGRLLKRRCMTVTTAESCTGGLVAGAITSTSGSSDWFGEGFVTYSNDAKRASLGVTARLLAAHGAVS